MKNSILSIFFLSSVLFSFGQRPEAGDQVIGDKSPDLSWETWTQRKNKHWQGFDIGINTLIFEDGSDTPPAGYESLRIDYGRSFYFGLNLGEKDIQLYGEFVKIVTGIGFDFYNFQLRGNDVMYKRNDSLMFEADSIHSFKNNNLKNSHITVPLLLAFNTSPKNSTSFHIAIGAIFSYRLSGKQKIQYNIGEQCHTYMVKSEMLQNPWKAAATLRLGYSNFHVFANYALTDFWITNSGPKAKSLVVGLKVLPW